MILPEPVVFTKPLHVWLGMIILLLLLIQIYLGIVLVKTGKKQVRFFHTKIVWVVLIIIALIHGFYGFQIYFLK
jgi:hypothetical protein